MPRPRRRLSIPARLREAGPITGPRQKRATKKAGERPAVRRSVQTAAPEVPEAFHLAQAQQPALPAVQQSVHPGSQTASTAQPIMGQPTSPRRDNRLQRFSMLPGWVSGRTFRKIWVQA